MSRGIMYHIALDENCCGSMSADDFFDSLDLLHVDSVADQAPEDCAKSLKSLLDWLEKAGFCIIQTGLPENCAAILKTGSARELENCKRKRFVKAFKTLKDKVTALSLDTFAADFVEVSSIRDILEDTHADAVYYDAGLGPGTYTLDGFMRRLEPDRSYFISANTVWMQ